MPRRILSLFRNLLRKPTVEQALDDEVRSSVEILAEEKMKDGLSRPVALRQALIELGGVEQVKEEVRAIRVGNFLENFTRDLRLTFRTLAKAPSFTAVVVLTPGSEVTPDELRHHCAETLAGYKVPKRVELAAALPRTPSGKLMRRALR